MGWTASHTITYLTPTTRPTLYDQEFRMSPPHSNGPVSISYIPPIEIFTNLVWYPNSNLYFRCSYHYHFLADPPDYILTWIGTYDKSTGLVNISSNYETPTQQIILAISIPFEYRGYSEFWTSKKVDHGDWDDVTTWYSLPQTINWDNEGSGTEDKWFHIHVGLGNMAFPIRTPDPPPLLKFPIPISIGQQRLI